MLKEEKPARPPRHNVLVEVAALATLLWVFVDEILHGFDHSILDGVGIVEVKRRTLSKDRDGAEQQEE